MIIRFFTPWGRTESGEKGDTSAISFFCISFLPSSHHQPQPKRLLKHRHCDMSLLACLKKLFWRRWRKSKLILKMLLPSASPFAEFKISSWEPYCSSLLQSFLLWCGPLQPLQLMRNVKRQIILWDASPAVLSSQSHIVIRSCLCQTWRSTALQLLLRECFPNPPDFTAFNDCDAIAQCAFETAIDNGTPPGGGYYQSYQSFDVHYDTSIST